MTATSPPRRRAAPAVRWPVRRARRPCRSRPREPALAGYRRVLANLADTIEANRPGTIEDIDEEFLHDLRVAVRRTRSVLSQGKGVLPDDVRDRYREAFGALGQQTGPARDLDVYVVGWDDYVAPLGLTGDPGLEKVRREIERRRRAAHAELSAVLDERRVPGGARRLAGLARRPRVEVDPTPHLGPSWPSGSRRRSRRCSPTAGRSPRTSPGERLHDLRKDTKKLRYLLECFGSLFPADERKAFVSQLKELQDNLGEHQDAEVHLAQLRDLAHDLHERAVVDTDALLAMGRLSDLLERRRSEERAAFAKRFARYDRKANRKALAKMLDRDPTRMKVLATYSIKGGVGKTTTAVNLAYEAGRAGVRVLVWDLDPQGAATYLLRVRPKVRGGSRKLVSAKGALADHVRGTDLDAVHVLPADFSLRHLDVHLEGTREPTRRIATLLDPVRDHYDLAILDCPPSISLASESVFGAADTLLVPVVPATLASRTLGQLTSFLDDQLDAPAVAPFLSMVDRRRRLHRELVDSLGSEWPELLATADPGRRRHRADGDGAGTARPATPPSTPAARAYRRLWGEVATSLWGDAG